MLNALYNTAARIGVDVLYEAEVTSMEIDNGMFVSATARIGGTDETVRAGALVAAAGGFESNIEWLKEYWGDWVYTLLFVKMTMLCSESPISHLYYPN